MLFKFTDHQITMYHPFLDKHRKSQFMLVHTDVWTSHISFIGDFKYFVKIVVF